MKGTDVTPEQITHAEEFLARAAHGTELRKCVVYYDTQALSLKRQDLVRLLAWYGAIRAKNGNVNPGRLVTRAADMSAAALECGAASEFIPTPELKDPRDERIRELVVERDSALSALQTIATPVPCSGPMVEDEEGKPFSPVCAEAIRIAHFNHCPRCVARRALEQRRTANPDWSDDPDEPNGLTEDEAYVRDDEILAAGPAEPKPPSGLWRRNPATPEGKYLVVRRDGTIPEWPSLVIGGKDPCAPAAILALAYRAEELGFNAQYVTDMRWLAGEFERYRAAHGNGDPDRGRHRKDDPAIIEKMRKGGSM